MSKLFNAIVSLVCFGGICYFVYHAIYGDAGMTATVLRLIAAFIMAFVVIWSIIEGRTSQEDYVYKWYVKDEPKGILLYLYKYGVLLSGVVIGYLSWVFVVDFENNHNLFSSAILHMGSLMLGGVFGTWMNWMSNKSKARKYNLDARLLEDESL